jgi:type VI secretion system protein ImpA
MNIDRWLEAAAEAPPCGPSLEYDPAYLQLEELATGTPERQYGDVVIAAEPPDWRDVFAKADALLLRSKDMRVVSLLARAALNVHGLPGFADALALANQLAQQYWDELHPSLTYDGAPDPVMRANAIAGLAATEEILRELRASQFVQQRGVAVSIRDAEICLSPGDGTLTTAVTREQLSGLVAEALSTDPTVFDALTRAHTSAVALSAKCTEKLGTTQAPDLKPLANLLGILDKCVSNARELSSLSASGDAAFSGATVDGGVAPGAGIRSGNVIQSRADASLTLDAVCKYFEHYEPASPVPILLRRAQRLIGMSFVEIIRDMAPDSMSRIDIIAGENSN